MIKLIVRLLVNALSIWAAAALIDGVTLDTENTVGIVVVAAVFGIVNAILKPIAKVFSFPFIFLTLGIFTLFINAGLFALTASVTSALNVNGFGAAFFGAIVVSIVSWFLGIFVDDDDDD